MEVSSEIQERIRALLSERPQRDPYKRFTILTYQLADVGKCLRYMDIYPEDRPAQVAYFKTAMADLLIQVLALATLNSLDVNELARLGADRLEEFRKKGTYVEAE
jgi:hypothetical protein